MCISISESGSVRLWPGGSSPFERSQALAIAPNAMNPLSPCWRTFRDL